MPSSPMYRTQMRLERTIDHFNSGLHYELVISGWNPHRHVSVPASIFPEGMTDLIESSPGVQECTIYIYAFIDYTATSASKLNFQGPWELHKALHYGDMKTDENGTVTDFGVRKLQEHIWDERNSYVYL